MTGIWVWIVLGLAPVLAATLMLQQVLFYPWRVKPLHRFLYQRSRLYRRWCWRQFIQSIKKSERVMGEQLIPAMQKATASFRHFAEVQRKVAAMREP